MQSIMAGKTITPEMSTKLVGAAMAEAGKLMDQHGASSGANKQDAMSAAAKVAMQMLAQVGTLRCDKTGGTDYVTLGRRRQSNYRRCQFWRAGPTRWTGEQVLGLKRPVSRSRRSFAHLKIKLLEFK